MARTRCSRLADRWLQLKADGAVVERSGFLIVARHLDDHRVNSGKGELAVVESGQTAAYSKGRCQTRGSRRRQGNGRAVGGGGRGGKADGLRGELRFASTSGPIREGLLQLPSLVVHQPSLP